MLEILSGSIIHFISSTGYGGIFLLMTIGASVFPVPSEVILTFSGFLVHLGRLNFILVVFFATMGDILGSLVPYAIGYFLEEKVIVGLIKKHGKYILVSENEYQRAAAWFSKYGDKAVFIGKLVPGIRWIIALPAGVFEMNVWKFITYAMFGSLIWTGAVTYVGFYLGSKWQSLSGYFRQFEIIIVVLLVLAVFWYLNHKLRLFK